MTPPRTHPPIGVMLVLDRAIDAMLGGSWGWLHVPPAGRLDCAWLPNKKCYRITIDVTAGHELTDDAEAFNQETRRKLAAIA